MTSPRSGPVIVEAWLNPVPGPIYLVRARILCGASIYGRHSDGTAITSAACGM